MLLQLRPEGCLEHFGFVSRAVSSQLDRGYAHIQICLLKKPTGAKPGSCVTELWRVCTTLRIGDGFVPILRKERGIMGWQND